MKPKKSPRQKRRTKWLAGATQWQRVGTESYEESILITRIKRKPPSYRLEYVRDDGKIMAAMLVKSPKGTKGYDVVLDGLHGFHAPTRRNALRAFGELHKKLEQAAAFDGIDRSVGESVLEQPPSDKPLVEQLREAADALLKDGQP